MVKKLSFLAHMHPKKDCATRVTSVGCECTLDFQTRAARLKGRYDFLS